MGLETFGLLLASGLRIMRRTYVVEAHIPEATLKKSLLWNHIWPFHNIITHIELIKFVLIDIRLSILMFKIIMITRSWMFFAIMPILRVFVVASMWLWRKSMGGWVSTTAGRIRSRSTLSKTKNFGDLVVWWAWSSPLRHLSSHS